MVCTRLAVGRSVRGEQQRIGGKRSSVPAKVPP